MNEPCMQSSSDAAVYVPELKADTHPKDTAAANDKEMKADTNQKSTAAANGKERKAAHKNALIGVEETKHGNASGNASELSYQQESPPISKQEAHKYNVGHGVSDQQLPTIPKSMSESEGTPATQVEPNGHNDLYKTLHLGPAVSAPPSTLVNQFSENYIKEGEVRLSPAADDNDAEKSFSRDISDKGLQRAQTLPCASDACCTANKKAAAQGTGKHYGHMRSGKFSKRKQKKLVKRLATVKPNGTVEFDVNDDSGFASDLFGPQVDDIDEEMPVEIGEEEGGKTNPPMQIVMLIVGTRGDVQPFVAIGKHLQEYGHRVRLATHANFRDFVMKEGLEFFPLGGDPKVLAEYMVKNKGFLPSGPSEIRKQRKQLKSIINSLLPACIDPYESSVAFKAQAIIANPPTYGHVHVAEALKVPLHMFFTMPWTPTSEFPHPLSRVHRSAANRISYQVVDSLIWWGIRDIINDFRKKKLKLRPITYLGASQPSVSKLPAGYLWSPSLVPKPKDWGPKVDVVGFCFLNMSRDYQPPEPLRVWLEQGDPPIYVGFGSLPVEDPKGMTEIIVNALSETCQRGIIDKGWGGMGDLVHHGGAGTTAAGLKAACPTTVVPFFGDQPFWGDRVHEKGVGPAPIPVGQFSFEKLVHAINFMLDPEVKQRAVELAEAIKGEDGVAGAVKAFHKHLPKEMAQTSHPEPPKSFLERVTGLKAFSCFGSDLA